MIPFLSFSFLKPLAAVHTAANGLFRTNYKMLLYSRGLPWYNMYNDNKGMSCGGGYLCIHAEDCGS